MATDKIKRSFVWLRKTLGIIDKTTLPGEVLGQVRPVMDLFGWDRLEETVALAVNAAQPAIAVASATPPEGVVRLILAASLEQGDTGVTHTCWLLKRRNPGPFDIGLPTDRTEIQVGEFCSMIGTTFLVNNDFIIGEMLVAPIAGVMALRTFHIDLDPGEYMLSPP